MITLLFDLDDTLVDSESAYIVGMTKIGIDPKDATFLKARSLVKSELPLQSPIARSRFLYFKKYLELKLEYSAHKHLDLSEAYEKSVVATMQTQWHELQRPKLFQKLLQLSKKIFLVTNESTRMQVLKLRALDPDSKIFSGLVVSEECGFEKPHPQIYQQALLRSQSEAKNCIMVGDNYVNDIEGAVKCGISAIQTLEFRADSAKSKLPTHISQNIHTISNLNDLPQKLEELST